MFKYEFRFRAGAGFDQIFDATVTAMADAGTVQLTASGAIQPGAGSDGWSGREWLVAYAGVLDNFFEGYRVAARGLSFLLDKPLSEKDLVKKSLAAGGRMFLTGEIERREAVSKSIMQNALAAFRDQGIIELADGKLALSEAHRSQDAVTAIETSIADLTDRAAESRREVDA
jgi:glycerol-3-phosphate O-acyltransferase